MSEDAIKRSDVIDVIQKWFAFADDEVGYNCLADYINALPTIDADRPKGEWEERETFHNADDNPIIEEWQSARCSVCNKYHTTPYMYYFDKFNFCPNCGSDNRGEDNE